MDRSRFILIGVAVALIIAASAPFLASGNPDGLESAFFGIFGAKEIRGDDLDEERAALAEEEVVQMTGNDFTWESPFPDYTIAGLDKSGEVAAIVLGTLIVLLLGLGISRAASRQKT
ncbi:MAG: PDGLE domain-containing protein [Methanomicrobiales archaeon]|nr:PDGLE domain-containing protein [Methanomicrobiales archaeon]MDI6877274.1 PDGLE domain-containing protein [Methanomicrobiales archaeon]